MFALILLTTGAAAPAGATAGQRADLALARSLLADARRVPSLERALALAEGVNGPWHRETAEALSLLWKAELARGDGARAAAYKARMLRVEYALYGAGRWRAVEARWMLGTVLMLPGLGPAGLARLSVAYIDDATAEALKRREQYRAAAQATARALPATRALLGEWHPLTINLLSSLAIRLADAGEPARALPLARRALALREAGQGEWHPQTADAHANLAVIHQDMGDGPTAVEAARRALRIREAALGRGGLWYAASVHRLGALYRVTGQYRAALPLLREARELFRGLLGVRSSRYAHATNSLGVLLKEMGDLSGARPLYEEAVPLMAAIHGVGSRDHATAMSNLAGLRSAAREYREALPPGEAALAAFRGVLGPRHADYATMLANLAEPYIALGRHSAAAVLCEQSLHVTETNLRLWAAVQSERQQMASLDVSRYRVGLRLSIPDGEGPSPYGHLLAWKGAAFALARERRLYAAAASAEDARVRSASRRSQEAARRLAALAASGGAEARREAEALARVKEAAEAELAGLSAAFRLARATPADVAAALPAGVVLLDFVAYRRYIAPSGRPWLSAFVLRRGGVPTRVDLGPAAPVEEAVAAWRRLVEKGRHADGPGSRLRRLVWAPLEKHAAGASLVLISPDGVLGRLPFGALPGAAKGYLIEEVPLAVVPCRACWPPPPPRHTRARPSSRSGEWRSVKAAAGRRCRAARLRPTPSPPASSRARGGSRGLGRTRRPCARRWPACATRTWRRTASTTPGRDGGHPGLQSGLVFARANRPTAEDDGLLTALEVSELDLSGLELAVLSACETGLGKEAAGEGMLGLQRAFAVAGCRSVLSSLWSVHDAATSVLMERFYLHLWSGTMGKIEALRQAQIHVLNNPDAVERRMKALAGVRGLRGLGVAEEAPGGAGKRRSPAAWWAAWQLSGDWR